MMNKAVNRKYLIATLFALSFVLYARTLNYGFVWDDERIHLTNNQQLMKGDVTSFWTQPYSGMYIPVTYTTWTFVKSISISKKELSPKLFHLLNVITHSINGVLVFLLLSILFKNQTQAFWGSVLFLLHPLQVESVAWISEFRGLYSVFFSLLSLISIFRYFEKNAVVAFRAFVFSKQFIIASVLFVFALLAKPSAVVLPFIASILVWCFYKEHFKSITKGLSVWFLFIIPILLITKHSQTNEFIYASISLWQRFLIAGNSLFFYLYKLIVPYPLVACYGYTPELIVSNIFSYFSMFFCVFLAIVLFIKRKSNPILFSSFGVIAISVFPVLGLVSFEYQKHSTVADHYMYFGMLGVTLLIPLISECIKKYNYLKYISGGILIIYVVLNIQQTSTWKNEFTIWDNTLTHYQNSPNVYYNRGVEYSKIGNFNAAINDYTQCLALQKDYRDALFNRANAYENLNDINEAFADYNTYLSVDSTDGSVYYKRAYLNYKTGNINGAINDVGKAEQLGFSVGNKFKKTLNDARMKQLRY
jgi:tetratricopeptide (TPR) repeat protein